MLNKIKKRCGIHESVTIYDDEILDLIASATHEMIQSGISIGNVTAANAMAVNAVACYVKAYLGDDRSDTATYLEMFRDKTVRLVLDESLESEVANV